MQVFKFGGASVKDAAGVKNVAGILNRFSNEKLLVVISAMGKTTNALETLVEETYNKTGKSSLIIEDLKKFHYNIISELDTDGNMFYDVDNLFLELECLVETPPANVDYDFLYDQIVAFGELISTRIVSAYLNTLKIKNAWLDARNFIITSNRYRDAKVQWSETQQLIENRLKPFVQKNMVLTQGFIGRGPLNETTTLGREGSDYSAAIFAYSLNAQAVTIWKDVAGVMNGDPKKLSNAQLLSELNYNDTIELAYYGASVIHPKTIQPLKAKSIPLYVKSFINPDDAGTVVNATAATPEIPCYIHKSNQVMINLSTRDYTFIVEDNLREIFRIFAEEKIKCNIIQNSAISFSVAADGNQKRLDNLKTEIEKLNMEISVTEGLNLLTVYNAKPDANNVDLSGKKFLMEQHLGKTVHVLYE